MAGPFERQAVRKFYRAIRDDFPRLALGRSISCKPKESAWRTLTTSAMGTQPVATPLRLDAEASVGFQSRIFGRKERNRLVSGGPISGFKGASGARSSILYVFALFFFLDAHSVPRLRTNIEQCGVDSCAETNSNPSRVPFSAPQARDGCGVWPLSTQAGSGDLPRPPALGCPNRQERFAGSRRCWSERIYS